MVKDNAGKIPLFNAGRYGDSLAVSSLLKQSFGANHMSVSVWRDDSLIKDNAGHTPLFNAAKYGGAVVVQTLLTHGFYPNHMNDSGVTSLLSASYPKLYDVVRVLLDNGACPSVMTEHQGMTPLLYAI